MQTVLSMIAGITLIILATTRFKVPAFFAILLACLVTGLGLQMSLTEIIGIAKSGFGEIMKALGFIIVLGTALGVILEKTGATSVLANYILRKVGDKNASLAISITGFIVGLPVFCDSGYIVLSGLNRSMIRRTGASAITMSVSLATGLYVVHCLLPPHPGAAMAAGTLKVEFGTLIGYGLLVAIPVMFIAHAWAVYIGKKRPNTNVEQIEEVAHPEEEAAKNKPSVIRAFLPIIIPILLISIRSLLLGTEFAASAWGQNLLPLGDPVIALSIAILLALNKGLKGQVGKLLEDSLVKAGSILLIIGAGGAFGAILFASNLGSSVAQLSFLNHVGILFPFVIAAILKTAQGSSTVAIITASSIVLPVLQPLGLDSDNGRLLCVLSLGAGSMLISHANDAYFWVISRFSGIDMRSMLRAYTTASIIMGLSSLLFIWILSLFLL